MNLKGITLSSVVSQLLACQAAVAVDHTQKANTPMHSLKNALVRVDVAPQLGGRVMNYQLGEHRFFWANPKLKGVEPPPSKLAPDGTWLNWGGDKLWPAPQGWDDDRQWPGPPDVVLDGGAYELSTLRVDGHNLLRLVSPPDRRTGVQFSRTIRLVPGSSRVAIEATMKNISDHITRWGTWSVTQLNAGKADGSGWNPLFSSYLPLNRDSKYPKGYRTLFGSADNAQFRTVAEGKLLRMRYGWTVGKVGLDADEGWAAAVDGSTGYLFVQRFAFQNGVEYPDGASVELWTNGLGHIHAWGKETEMPTDPVENPYVVESEVLSPFAELQPGQESHFAYEWASANVGGDYPVLACTAAGCICEALTVTRSGADVLLRGRFGVFYTGVASLEFVDARGRVLQRESVGGKVSPLSALVLGKVRLIPPAGTVRVRLGVRPAGAANVLPVAEAALP